MNGPIRVAAVQLAAHDRSGFVRSLDPVLEATQRAGSRAQLVVLPEATLPAYVLGSEPVNDEAVEAALERLAQIARSTGAVVVVGAAVRAGAGLQNAAVVIDADGSIAGRAGKIFLWHFDRRWFARGDRIAPIQTAIGPLGALVCADGRLPTIARALVDAGARALVMPTAWVTSGRDPTALENVQADLLARVRAYENGVPFVAANKCGAEQAMVAYCGKSQIVDRRGEPLALASQSVAETIFAEIELGAPPRRALPPQPPPRAAAQTPLRVAISFHPLPPDIDERLEVLDDAFAISPDDDARLGALDRTVALAAAGDDVVLDPAGLVGYRRANYQLVVWTTDLPAPWAERIARARALELRLYVVVFDAGAQRAFAVDPDGTVLAGTFGEYRLASFTLDPRKTKETAVAPGTDVGDGIAWVAAVLGRQERGEQ